MTFASLKDIFHEIAVSYQWNSNFDTIQGRKLWEHTRLSSVERSDFFHGIPHNFLAVREGKAHRTHGDLGLQARQRNAWQLSRGRG
ncbi:unnamed protein product [Strongylus vulgaris]|uniref:Uncharacterized protein n=1 Tax=Strongylus vulgaris TaxID=40348 RepID=A0A3P7LMB2_STRVU|nr:unnamed protein product [Strongylus vulgaris]